jgi:hypothetical protein
VIIIFVDTEVRDQKSLQIGELRCKCISATAACCGLSVDGQRLVGELHRATFCEVSRCMAVTLEHPLCGQQPFHTHWSPGVNAGRTDTHFSTCTETHHLQVRCSWPAACASIRLFRELGAKLHLALNGRELSFRGIVPSINQIGV